MIYSNRWHGKKTRSPSISKEKEATFIQRDVINVTGVSWSVEGYGCYSIHTFSCGITAVLAGIDGRFILFKCKPVCVQCMYMLSAAFQVSVLTL